MRKKLLALMMCATMVLGTVVTASAKVYTEDSYKAAEKVISNGSKITAEYEGAKKVTWTTTDKTTGKLTTWGLKDFETPVKLNADGKPLTYVGLATEAFATKDGEFVNAEGKKITKNQGADYLYYETADTTVQADMSSAKLASAVAGSTFADSAVVAGYNAIYNKNIVNASANAIDTVHQNNTVVGGVTTSYNDVTYSPAKTFVTITDGGTTYVVAENGAKIATLAGTTATVGQKKVAQYTAADRVSTANPFVAADGKTYYRNDAGLTFEVDQFGYINVVDADVELVNMDSKSVVGDATYYITLTKFGGSAKVSVGDATRTLAYAIDEEKISADSVAVAVRLYKLVDTTAAANQAEKQKKLVPQESVSTTTTITLPADVLSRTNLKAVAGVNVYTIDGDDTETKDGTQVKKLESLGSVAVDGSFTFSVKDYSNQILIFDKAAVESTDNAGQADSDKATTDKADKTGDTAPIAALAVVMLGAFGAMVVASKKRA